MKVEINHIAYHVGNSGKGFPLVLLHGFTGDSSTWTPFFGKWGNHSQLIIPDIIGHGKTSSPEDVERYRMEAMANDLKSILDKLGIEKVDVLGYSMGGRLALTFALLFSNRVRKLVLESASPGLLTEKEREFRRMKDGELAKFIIDHGIVSFVDYWEEIPLFSTMKSLPESIKKSIRTQRLNNSSVGLSNSLLGMGTGAQPSWWGKLDTLTCEVLLLTGVCDTKFFHIAEMMMKELQSGTWIPIENSGHAIHVEEKEKFGTIVSDFLITN